MGDKKYDEIINPDDSLYLKPFIKHSFRGSGKLLILRIGGKITGDSQRELSLVGNSLDSRQYKKHRLSLEMIFNTDLIFLSFWGIFMFPDPSVEPPPLSKVTPPSIEYLKVF